MIRKTDAIIMIAAALALGLMFGSRLADDSTLKDCSTKESAVLMGGTTIECTVRKEAKK